MKIDMQWVTCKKCKHQWTAGLVVDTHVAVFLASMKAISCPACGAGFKHIGLGRAMVPIPAPDKRQMPDGARRAAWLDMHDNGLSSECIADVMCGRSPAGHYPHDSDDFGRCERLLILYPAWRARLGEMAAVSRQWAALVSQWTEIAETWRDDMAASQGGKRAATWRCTALMRDVLKPAEMRA